ncbi:hypothetical protein LZS85_07290 [Aliivibrio fischeri]|uniref:phosphorylase family protein n=1 Tax=Aliivibrio fischeri TaxID=668 RepID=UPI001F2D315F|nr:hypothetical protein [Aliivibrio fischeri]MCE7565909.1 hypothetical protein [Aliivibrio fischeri]
MNIILIEDTNQKSHAIVNALKEIKSDLNIKLFTNAKDAKDELKVKKYDIAIVDLSLPKFLGADPVENGGYCLLTEILDSGLYVKPNKIICLTEHSDLLNDYKEIISDDLITIHQFSYSDDKWKAVLKKEIERKATKLIELPKEYEVDFLVISALKEPEFSSLLKLKYNWKEPELIDDSSIVYSGTIATPNKNFSIKATYQDRMGSVSSSIITTKLINKYSPKYVVMVGICAGDQDATNIGDIILAKSTSSWESGKWVREDKTRKFKYDPHHIYISSKITGLFDMLSANNRKDIFSIHDDFPSEKPSNVPKIHIGAIACGSSVIAENTLYNDIKDIQGRKLLGIDMESYGLYAACDSINNPKPEFFCIKSICDFANEAKNDNYQHYSSYISASIFDLFVNTFDTRL